MKTVTQREWEGYKVHGYAVTKPDGSHWLLYMDERGITVFGPVEIVKDGE